MCFLTLRPEAVQLHQSLLPAEDLHLIVGDLCSTARIQASLKTMSKLCGKLCSKLETMWREM